MKRTMLLSAAAAVAASAFAFIPAKTAMPVDTDLFSVGPKAPASFHASTRATGEMNFSYAGDAYTQLSFNNTTAGVTRAYMMVQMKPEDIQKFKGNQITKFNIISPCDKTGKVNTIKTAEAFIATSLSAPIYTQTVSLGTTGYEENSCPLDKPYTITGDEQELYFGYSVLVPEGTAMYYVPIDYEPNNYEGSCLIATVNGTEFPSSNDWGTAASDYGALCLGVTIAGENMPGNLASFSGIYIPPYLPTSGSADWQVEVRNDGANAITSLELVTTVEGEGDFTQTFNLLKPISYNETAILAPSDIHCSTPGFAAMTVRITKINGVEVDLPGAETQKFAAYDVTKGFSHKMVVEDATGTWCPWCPGGIVALEYLKKNYPERTIAIGAHTGDRMAISGYAAFISEYVSGYPCLWFNRMLELTPTVQYSTLTGYLKQYADFVDYNSYATVSLTGNVRERYVDVTATTEFIIDSDVQHGLSFVVVQDGLGPYDQANNFSAYNVPMDGWENKAATVSTIFDDVARTYLSYPYISGSLPETIEAGKKIEFSTSVPITAVLKNKEGATHFRVIALLTNTQTGEIVNACEVPFTYDTSGVENIAADENGVSILGGNGEVVVNGTDAYSVYTTAGVKVANRNLPAGLYIVVAGGKTAKVIVK